VRSGGARGPTIEKAASQRLRDSAAGLEVGVDQRTLELQAVHLALRESEELFRRIFGDAPIGAALPDPDRRLTHVKRARCDAEWASG
jgi:PAS domain-containing protein